MNDSNRKIRFGELKPLLVKQLKATMAYNEGKKTESKDFMRVTPILLKGAAGIGKSSVIFQIGQALGVTVRDRRLSQFPDSGEIIGLPKVSFVDIGGEHEDEVTKHIRPNWLPKEDEGWNILFLDEFNRAQLDVRQAVFQLLTEWKCGMHNISPKTIIILAINPDNGDNYVESLDQATISRLIHYDIEVSPTDWIKWAYEAGIHSKVVAWIEKDPDNLYPKKRSASSVDDPFACPRTWHFLSNVMNLECFDDDELFNVAQGCIGKNPASAFMQFIKTEIDPLTFDDIINNPEKVKAEMLDKKTGEMKYQGSKMLVTLNSIEKGFEEFANIDQKKNENKKVSIDSESFVQYSLSDTQVLNVFTFLELCKPEVASSLIHTLSSHDNQPRFLYWIHMHGRIVKLADPKRFKEWDNRIALYNDEHNKVSAEM